MTEKELIQQLKNLKASPEAGALDKTKADLMCQNLMARIENGAVKNEVIEKGIIASTKAVFAAFAPRFQFGAAFRYAVTLCAVFAVGMAGCLTTVSASFNSMPGDTLYTIKIATEKVQLALAQDDQMKINLRTEFAGRRIDEMKQIIESTVSNKEDRLDQAISGLKTEVNNVGDSLNDVGNNQFATGTAKTINEKMDELNTIIVRNAVDFDNVKTIQEDINGIMVQKGITLHKLNGADIGERKYVERASSSSTPLIYPSSNLNIETPKKVQWQIIIEE